MVNKFHRIYYQRWNLSIHIREIGYNGSNLIQKLDKDPVVNYVTIRGNIYDSRKIDFIMDALTNTQVKTLMTLGNLTSDVVARIASGLKNTSLTCLNINCYSIGSDGVKYLADVLKDTCLTDLPLYNAEIGDVGMKYLAEGLKNSNLLYLGLECNGITSNGIKYLADVLQDTNLTCLDLSNDIPLGSKNEIKDKGVKYLADRLKNSCITKLALMDNKISNYGTRYLFDRLKETCITSVSILPNDTRDDSIQCLAQILSDTKIQFEDYKYDNYKAVVDAISRNRTDANKIKEMFEKVVAQNTETLDLEFIIPDETNNFDIADYLYIIKTMKDNEKIKGHIFAMIKEHHCNYPGIIRKVNEFIATLPNKFNTFLKNKFPDLIKTFESYDYVNFVKQVENLNLQETVQYLLLHRTLYYVDENNEILHPYIYKLLDKYNMPLYNEQLEPDKKNKVISFFQDHQEIDGAQEVINLLHD